LRAGLLSDPEVIKRLNKTFVCTSVIIDDAQKRADAGDPLAKQLASLWEYPIEMLFFTPDGRLVSKLNSAQDFPGIHLDVVAPPKIEHKVRNDGHSHEDIFLSHIAGHFGTQ
jgi:hypothetical protein